MAFQEIANSETTDADKVLENFYKIGRGSRLPYGSNSTLDPTTGVFNLGGTGTVGGSTGVYYWSNLYIDDIEMTGEIDKVWYRLTVSTIAATTGTITFGNLNGDTDIAYMLITYIKYTPATTSAYGLYFNSDTGTNYGWQSLYCVGGGAAAERTTGSNFLTAGKTYGQTTTAEITYAKNIIYAKTGNTRTMLSDILESGSGNRVYRFNAVGGAWTDTTSTITSMTIFAVNTTGGIEPDSYFELWVRR